MIKLIQPIIKSNREIADKIYELIVIGDFKGFKPGSFVHIKCSAGYDPLLRRPISICDVRDNELVLLYRAEGRGTSLLSVYSEGDSVDILAPLGNGFDLETSAPGTSALLIGGGIGVPPLYYLGRLLKERGVVVKSIIGFNQSKDVFYAEEFAELGETWVTTIGHCETRSVEAIPDGAQEMQGHCERSEAIPDGAQEMQGHCERSEAIPTRSPAVQRHCETRSVEAIPRGSQKQNGLLRRGAPRNDIKYHSGLVTDLLDKVGPWDQVYSCGPTAMLKALQKNISPEKTAFISLEERMGCGVGACLACVCDLNESEPGAKSYVRVCTEGPVFNLHEVLI